MKRTRWKVLKDGEWESVPSKGHRNACCDCGLVHVIEYRLSDSGKLEVRFVRDERATAIERRKMKSRAIVVEDK